MNVTIWINESFFRLLTHRKVKCATTPDARPTRRLPALQLVGIELLFRLVVRAAASIHWIDSPLSPCQTPRGTHPRGRPTAVSRFNRLDLFLLNRFSL